MANRAGLFFQMFLNAMLVAGEHQLVHNGSDMRVSCCCAEVLVEWPVGASGYSRITEEEEQFSIRSHCWPVEGVEQPLQN